MGKAGKSLGVSPADLLALHEGSSDVSVAKDRRRLLLIASRLLSDSLSVSLQAAFDWSLRGVVVSLSVLHAGKGEEGCYT